MTRNILVTGAAGFIGYHTARRLLERGDRVVGLDNLDPCGDVALKEARLRQLERFEGFTFARADVVDAAACEALFDAHALGDVVHLAARVGVRASVDAPRAYVDTNVVGFLNIIEGCRRHAVRHLVYASSSSVYGSNRGMPYRASDRADHPVSVYGASKRATELMAHSYSHLFGLPTTGLRFFTVYGPWGRPDMAPMLFARAIVEGRPIDLFNHGDMARDFTFVDDVVEGLVRALDRPPAAGAGTPDPSAAPHRIYNVGRGEPVRIDALVEALEAALGRRALRRPMPMQPGDIQATHADVADLEREVGYAPKTDLRDGVEAFVTWFCDHYGVAR